MSTLLPTHNKRLGKTGEDTASLYLTKKGYSVIARNFKARYGEIDIICVKDNAVIFVEVKARAGRTYGMPEEAVTPRKLQEIIQTAHVFMSCHKGLPERMQIDVIAIDFNHRERPVDIRHIESVTS